LPVPASYKLKDRYGVEHTLYYKERISAVTGIPVHTLTVWDKAGIIPFTPFRDSSGRKLYSLKHIEAIDEVFTLELSAAGIYDIDKLHLKQLLTDRFEQIARSMAQKFKGVDNYETREESKQRKTGIRGYAKRKR
jgi:DNA-binding transcriptional MerR regulator